MNWITKVALAALLILVIAILVKMDPRDPEEADAVPESKTYLMPIKTDDIYKDKNEYLSELCSQNKIDEECCRRFIYLVDAETTNPRPEYSWEWNATCAMFQGAGDLVKWYGPWSEEWIAPLWECAIYRAEEIWRIWNDSNSG